MEILFAVTAIFCALLLALILIAMLISSRNARRHSVELLAAIHASGAAEARARELAEKNLSERINVVATGVDATSQAIREFMAQNETLEKLRATEAKVAAGATNEIISKSVQHLEGLVSKLESLGSVAREVKSALEIEGNKRIESHSWLASELKSAIRELCEQVGRSQDNLGTGLKQLTDVLTQQIGQSQGNLTGEMKLRIAELTEQIGRLQASLEASLKF